MLKIIMFKKFLKYYLFFVLFSWIFLFIFGIYKYPDDLIYSLNELLLIFFSGIIVIDFYFSFNKNKFSKLWVLKTNKITIKIKIFLNILFFLFLLGVTYFFIFFLYDYVFNFDDLIFLGNIAANDETIHWFDPSYDYKVFYYFYAILVESIILITFWYFLCHFIKNNKKVFYILIVIFIYCTFFGNLFLTYVYKNANQKLIFNSNTSSNFLRFNINYFLMPWNQIGMIARRTFSNNMVEVNFWDYSNINSSNLLNMSIYNFVGWFWILYVISFIGIPHLIETTN